MLSITSSVFRRCLIFGPLVIAVCFLFSGCQKDTFITSNIASISTSADSLSFDTVFTSIGSTTQSFKIINTNSQKLLLSNVQLQSGASSPYTININGIASAAASNIEIAANDSIYVFVTVRINPNLADLPFIVQDTVAINYNGNVKKVGLQAYGQNANFLRGRTIAGNVIFTSNKPYVLLGGFRVDTNALLTLEPGCRIYAHADSPIFIDGTLIANGTKENPVIFTGDRLDGDYKDFPASWPGIYFRGSSMNNFLRYTIVKNAYQAIVAENPANNTSPKIRLQQCIVNNAYDAGILCIGSSIDADNSLIANCGSNINILLGGKYSFTNCTLAAYSSYISHKKPVLAINNFLLQNGSTITNQLNAAFTNCILWGEEGQVKDEIIVNKQGNDLFSVKFNNCLYRSSSAPSNSIFIGSIQNEQPLFDSIDVSKKIFDFHISNPAAPGINKGVPVSFLRDLDGNNRSNGIPDIGCYELK